MRHGSYILSICIFMASIVTLHCCKPSRQEQIKDDEQLISETLDRWLDRKVKIDYNIGYFTTDGIDSIDYPQGDSEFKILRYIDSTGCAPCRLQLTRYGDILSELTDSAHCKIDYLCIVASADAEKVRKATAGNFRKLPIWVDRTDSLNQINSFPTAYGLQTFLLDKEDRVLAVGDPSGNPYVKDLFLQILTNDTINVAHAPQTIITSEVEELLLGNIQPGDTIRRKITIKNEGDHAFFCKDVITSCDCTTAKLSPACLEPGQSGTIDVMLTEHDQTGEFYRTISIFGNIPEEYIIEISGTIIEKRSSKQ